MNIIDRFHRIDKWMTDAPASLIALIVFCAVAVVMSIGVAVGVATR